MIKSRAMLRIATLAALVLYCSSLPIADNNDRPEIIEIIAPAAAAQETLDSLNLGEPNAESSDRNKRTIGILRQLFPNLSQIIEKKIQSIVSFLISTVGRSLLAGAIGGGGGNKNSDDSGESDGKVSIALPAFDSDEDDEDDDEDTDNTSSNGSTPSISNRFNDDNSNATDTEVQTSNLEDTISPIQSSSMNQTPSNIEAMETTSLNDNSSTESNTSSFDLTTETMEPSLSSNSIPSSDTTSSTSTVSSPATAAENGDSENQLVGAESQHNEVRVQFTDPDGSQKDGAESKADGDLESAASDNDGLSLDDLDSPEENRDKRFLGGGDSSGGSSSGGGSGNFLFDIIRRPAESMARAAGQAFRILTGTDSIGLGITATHTAVRDIDNTNKLVAGSGGTEQSDEASNSTSDDGSDGSGKTGDAAYSEGIPGPVTRFFIIANRGIANLIQDLILRLAQTSERIVNFKARLITSII